jgi:hypothetical protein
LAYVDDRLAEDAALVAAVSAEVLAASASVIRVSIVFCIVTDVPELLKNDDDDIC